MTIEAFGILIYIFVFSCGLILGSFLNSWMWRIRENVRIINGFSICVHCRRQLVWYEKFPLFSYIFLCGRCRTCKKSIPVNYFLVEFFTAALWTLLVYFHVRDGIYSEWNVLRDILFLTVLIVTFFFDYFYQEILPQVIWLGLVVGLFVNIWALHYSVSSLGVGMLVGGGFFALQYIVSRGRWIGGGDVRLGIMMGGWLGWPNILVALFFAYVLGGIIGIVLLLTKRAKGKTAVPFGTFLAVGTFIALYWGNAIMHWYFRLLG